MFVDCVLGICHNKLCTFTVNICTVSELGLHDKITMKFVETIKYMVYKNILKFPLEAYHIIRKITCHNKNCVFTINICTIIKSEFYHKITITNLETSTMRSQMIEFIKTIKCMVYKKILKFPLKFF